MHKNDSLKCPMDDITPKPNMNWYGGKTTNELKFEKDPVYK